MGEGVCCLLPETADYYILLYRHCQKNIGTTEGKGEKKKERRKETVQFVKSGLSRLGIQYGLQQQQRQQLERRMIELLYIPQRERAATLDGLQEAKGQ